MYTHYPVTLGPRVKLALGPRIPRSMTLEYFEDRMPCWIQVKTGTTMKHRCTGFLCWNWSHQGCHFDHKGPCTAANRRCIALQTIQLDSLQYYAAGELMPEHFQDMYFPLHGEWLQQYRLYYDRLFTIPRAVYDKRETLCHFPSNHPWRIH